MESFFVCCIIESIQLTRSNRQFINVKHTKVMYEKSIYFKSLSFNLTIVNTSKTFDIILYIFVMRYSIGPMK